MKRKRDDGSPLNDTAKKHRRDDDENGENNNNDNEDKDKDNKEEDESEDEGEDEECVDEEQEQKSRRDRHDLTAHNLVQQLTCHTIPAKIILLCRLSAGIGSSCTSRLDWHS